MSCKRQDTQWVSGHVSILVRGILLYVRQKETSKGSVPIYSENYVFTKLFKSDQ